MRFAAALAAAGLSLIVLAAVAPPAGHKALAQPATTIDVGDLYFCDSAYQSGVCETTVSAGDTVEWQWVGSQVHTSTECGGDFDACPEPHLWDAPLQQAGTFSFTFDTPGAYLYRCQAHPAEMRGRITVLAAQEPTPSPEASPQASAPTATPTPVAQPTAVPIAGSAPPAAGASAYWWLAIVGGGFIVASGGLILLRARPR
jgi:plastocyanin